MKILFILLLILSTACQAKTKECHQIRVAIIDTGLDLKDERFKNKLCKKGHRNFALDEPFVDFIEHGTHVAGSVMEHAGDAYYCMLIFKAFGRKATGFENIFREYIAIKEAIKQGAEIINISAGGSDFNPDEYQIIKDNPQVIFVVAAGNDGANIDLRESFYYPASYHLNNVIPVGNIGYQGERVRSSNYGSTVRAWEIGLNVFSTLPGDRMGYKTGTSMSTAVHTGKLVDKMSKQCHNR